MSEPLTPEEEGQIRARLAKATPGPWAWEPVNEFDGEPSQAGGYRYQHIRSGYKGVADTYHASGMQCPDGGVIEPRHGRKEDADFIAHAPEDISRLLDTLKVLREENEGLKRRMPGRKDEVSKQ